MNNVSNVGSNRCLNVGVSKRLYDQLQNYACENGMSLNEYCVMLLSQGTNHAPANVIKELDLPEQLRNAVETAKLMTSIYLDESTVSSGDREVIISKLVKKLAIDMVPWLPWKELADIVGDVE